MTPPTAMQSERRLTVKHFIKQFVESFGRNQPLDLAAQLAYFALLAIFPFAMFLLTIVAYLPLHGLDQHITQALYQFMPQDAAKLCEQTLQEIVGRQHGWLLLITLVFAMWTASGGVNGLITALNRAYDVSETRPAWKVKLRALAVTLGGTVSIIVITAALLVGPTIIHAIWAFFGLGGAFDTVWIYLRWPVALLASTSMLAMMYYFLPNVRQKFHFITPGSVAAVLGWMLASLGFRIYVSHFASYSKSYGALGTVVVLLVWLYITGLTLILGGEINAILDRVHRGIEHVEKEPGPTTTHDPRPTIDGENRPRARRRSVRQPL
ncbi:MAG TPA: YihY/virulence factor BrkB family protein [Polyangia bacterium]|nr:YihY/virulence factor BrkB family protein [Polyangia bacterium]